MSEQCKTCKEIERIETVRYRCKWNRCFVDPNDVCFCTPSHYSKASLNSAQTPDIKYYFDEGYRKGIIFACEQVREILSHTNDEDCCGEMNNDACLSYEANCTLCKFNHAVESFRQQQEQP